MERITEKMLEGQVRALNERMGRPLEPWTAPDAPGQPYHANIGNIHLDMAYGGVQIVEMVGEGGGVRNLTDGFDTKRAVYQALRAMHATLDSTERHHREIVHVVPADWCPACEALGRKQGVTA